MKKILTALLVLVVVAGGTGYYFFNKKVPSMAGEKSDLEVAATALYQAYEADETAAHAQYGGKIVVVRGAVRESSSLEDGTPKVVLETGGENGVLCEFDPNTKHERTSFQPGETLTIKGECTGLNWDVQLARCVVVK
ncbi:MAG: OB-fold protein [Saprospiraceae bacterium]